MDDVVMNSLSTDTSTLSAAHNIDIQSIRFVDDFDEYRERASSGGSLYGVLRRQAFLRSPPTSKPSPPTAPGPAHRPMQRQRSRSLIQRSVALTEEKSLIKMLCDYTEMTKRQQLRLVPENRRHSEAGLTFETRLQKVTSPAIRITCPVTPKRRTTTQATQYCPSIPALPNSDLAEVESGSFHRELSPNGVIPSTANTLSSTSEVFCSSEQSGGGILLVPAPQTVCRRRSFARTQHGFVSSNDETVTITTPIRSSSSIQESGFDWDNNWSDDDNNPFEGRSKGRPDGKSSFRGSCSHHRVIMLGGPGVGKTAITQQFVTSEYMAAQNTSFDDGMELTISVVLEDEESILEFIDLPYNGELNTWMEYDVDGFIIVYSITDRRSYQKSVDLLSRIRGDASNTKPMILVANKNDLERSRIISKQEGKSIAEMYGSKYMDVSAILNHRVDDLLVEMLKLLRLSDLQKTQGSSHLRKPRSHDDSCLTSCLTKASRGGSLLRSLVPQRTHRQSKSCENLLRL